MADDIDMEKNRSDVNSTLVSGGNGENNRSSSANSSASTDKMFSLKKWNAAAMWSWDVECDTCAICRVQVMGKLIQLSSLNHETSECRKLFYCCVFLI